MGLGGKLAFDLTGVDPDGAVPPVGLPQRWENCYGVERADDSLCASWGVLLLYAASSVVPRCSGVSATERGLVPAAGRPVGCRGLRIFLRGSAVARFVELRSVARRGVFRRTAIFDARTKAGGVNGFARRWPNVVASSPETIARVDARWRSTDSGGGRSPRR